MLLCRLDVPASTALVSDDWKTKSSGLLYEVCILLDRPQSVFDAKIAALQLAQCLVNARMRTWKNEVSLSQRMALVHLILLARSSYLLCQQS